MSRFFRTSPEIYTAARAGLDAVFGHPKTATAPDGTEVVTLTCLPPAEAAPEAPGGLVLAAVHDRDCALPEVAGLIAGLLTGGGVEEITLAEFMAAVPEEQA